MSFRTETTETWNGGMVIADFNKANYAAIYEAAALVEGDAKALAPVDKAKLRQSIFKRVVGDDAEVIAPVDYAAHVEFGTRPHVITAKGKGLSDGKNFFGKSVKHPGTKAQPFMMPALTSNVNKIIAIFKKHGINLKWVRR